MNAALKRGLLGAALVATLAAVWFAPADEAVVAPSAAAAARAGGPAARARDDALEVLAVRDRALEVADEDEEQLFAEARWAQARAERVESAAPPLAAPPPPEPAQAPPLPFRVLGRHDEGGRATVFLQYQDQNLVVHVGDTIAEHYKVEALEGSTLSLRYLPLNQTQKLELGAPQ